jgi:small-conductance mechanosensitive channel
MGEFYAWLNQHNVNVIAVLATIGVLIGAAVLSYLLKRPLDFLRRSASRLRLPYETVLTTTRSLIGMLWIIVAMLVLEIWGVSVGGLWTLLVSAAAIVGVGFLATWTMISNITASFFIDFWRPFHLGDTIVMLPENLSGRVIDRNLMYVVVRENGGAVIQIPNNLFFQKMFKVSSAGIKTLFEEYESGTVPRPQADMDRSRDSG